MTLARALNGTKLESIKRQDGVQNGKPASARHRAKLPSDPSLMVGDEPQDIIAAKDSMNFRFVVQDRAVVTALGIEGWRPKCPEMLESGEVTFQGVYMRFHAVGVISSDSRPLYLE